MQRSGAPGDGFPLPHLQVRGHQAIRWTSSFGGLLPDGLQAFMAARCGVVSLGVMAGWEVDWFVEQGGFASMFLAGPPDAATLVSDELETPFTRQMFLAPDASVLALGAHVDREAGTPWTALLVGS